MRKTILLAACALGLASCSTLPPEGEPWQDEVRSGIISLDTGGEFAYETPGTKRDLPERYTYTHSVSGEGPWFRAWWDLRLFARDINNLDLTDTIDDHDTSILTRVRLNIDGGAVVRPWDFHLELEDARDIAGADDAAKDALDIRRLYLHLGSAYTSYGVNVGRFTLNAGSGRLWGSDEDDNVAPAFDGASVTIADAFHYRAPRYYTWRVDAWYLRPVAVNPESPNDSHAGYDIYGAYIEHRRFWPITVSCGLIGRKWRMDEAGETGTGASSSVDITGRGFGEGLERGFDFDAEASMQLGRKGGDPLWAWFLYGEVGHTFFTPWRPRAAIRLTWGSGDDDPANGRIHTYRAESGVVPLTEMGFTGLLGWSNCVTYQAELSMTPLPRASVHAAVRFGFLDSKIEPWLDRNGATVLHDPTGAAGGDLGTETDIWVEILPDNPDDTWRMRVGYGRFAPGKMPEALGRTDTAEIFFLEVKALF